MDIVLKLVQAMLLRRIFIVAKPLKPTITYRQREGGREREDHRRAKFMTFFAFLAFPEIKPAEPGDVFQ